MDKRKVVRHNRRLIEVRSLVGTFRLSSKVAVKSKYDNNTVSELQAPMLQQGGACSDEIVYSQYSPHLLENASTLYYCNTPSMRARPGNHAAGQ